MRPKIFPPGSRKPIPAYQHWKGLIYRLSESYIEKYPSYRNCTKDWDTYEQFYDWVISQVGYGLRDRSGSLFCLDKDLLQQGNYRYGNDTCLIIPPEINRFLVSVRSVNSELPVGIQIERGKYRADFSKRNLGRFDTLDEAILAYDHARTDKAKILAEKYVDLLDERAYNSLINYTPPRFREE